MLLKCTNVIKQMKLGFRVRVRVRVPAIKCSEKRGEGSYEGKSLGVVAMWENPCFQCLFNTK